MEEPDNVLLQVESLFTKIGNLPAGVREEALKKIKLRLDEPSEIETTPHSTLIVPAPPPTTTTSSIINDEPVQILEISIKRDQDDSNQCLNDTASSCANPSTANKDIVVYAEVEEDEDAAGEEMPVVPDEEGNVKMKQCSVALKRITVRSSSKNSSARRRRTMFAAKNGTDGGNDTEDDTVDEVARNEDPDFKPSLETKKRKRGVTKTHSCDLCSRLFATPTAVKVHRRVHTGERPYTCEQCGKDFTQKGALDIHIQRHEGKPRFHCAECDYKCYMKIDLIRHMPKHTGERNFQCDICGNQFTTDSRLKDHIKHVHERKERYVCQVCGFVTHRHDNLKRHLDIKHSTKELFECPICHEVLKQRWNFIVHMRRHTGERPHKCHICGKMFKSPSQVAAHRRIHGEGTYECPSCSRKFKTRDHLIRHQVVHTGLKPFGCPFCPYMCNVKGNINKHVKAVHKLSSFTIREMQKQSAAALRQDVPKPKEALERGALVAQEFLNKISLRKDENLSVDILKTAFEEQERSQAEEAKNTPKPEIKLSYSTKRRSRAGGKRSSLREELPQIEIHVDPNPVEVVPEARHLSVRYDEDQDSAVATIGVDCEHQTETIVLPHNVHYVCLQQDMASLEGANLHIQQAHGVDEGDDETTVLVIECIDQNVHHM